MSSAARDWLPAEVATRPVVRATVSQAVDDWSAHWFANHHIGVATFSAAPAGARAYGGRWWIHRKTVGVNCSKSATRRLSDWALDMKTDQMSLSNNDFQILERFEKSLIEDLATRVAAALGADGAAQDDAHTADSPFMHAGGVELNLTEERGGDVMSLAISSAVILPFVKMSLPARARSSGPVESRAKAAGATPIVLDAILGQASVSLTDLRDLAPGDVLMLDTALDDSATLSMPGDDAVVARAKLTDLQGQMVLTLQN